MVRPAPIDPPQIEAKLWEGFSPCMLGLDIGANVGQSVPHLRRFCDEVVAFEPAHESFADLQMAVADDPHVRVLQLALSDVDGWLELVAAPAKMETGQLVTVDLAADWNGEGDWDMTGAEYRKVPSATLDDWVQTEGRRPGFLKIDVEGHEVRVLLGGLDLLLGDGPKPEMLIEVHSRWLGYQIEDLFCRAYQIETVRHPNYAPESDLWLTHFWMKCWPV